MSRVEQAILDALKMAQETGSEIEAGQIGGAPAPSVRRALVNLTRRGLVTRRQTGPAYLYSLPANG